MKINIVKDSFLEAIQIVQTGGTGRTTLPILNNFLMEANSNKIKLVRTDMEMAVVHYATAEVIEPGAITIPLREFHDILQTLPSDREVLLEKDKTDKLKVICGKSKFVITGTDKKEYPIIPELTNGQNFSIQVERFQDLIQKTIFSASTQETRYVLNGLLWILNSDKLEIVGTDGRRLALASYEDMKGANEFKIIVPSKILNEAKRFIGILKPSKDTAIQISIASNQISFNMDNTTYISRLIEGNFPNYEQVIPKKDNTFFEGLTADILAITKRAALCSSEISSAVKYEIKQKSLSVNSSSQTMEFNDEVKIDYSGEDAVFHFNPQYIMDVLKNIDSEKIRVCFSTDSQPVLIKPLKEENYKYVVMPVKA